jgi:hypothetical protein
LDVDSVLLGIEDEGPDEESQFILHPSQFHLLPRPAVAGDDAEVEVGGDGRVDLPDLELPDVVALVQRGHRRRG